MSFRTIENDIKSGELDKARPILLCGDEQFLVEFYEKRLVGLFAATSLDISVFYGDESDDKNILSALETFPMFSPVRIVVVKNHPGLSAQGSEVGLSDNLHDLPVTSRLIFSAGKVSKIRKLYKAIDKYGAVYDFSRLDEADLGAFARKRFKALGVEITPDILEAFLYATGYLEKDSDRDLFTVENDAYKLSSYALAEGRTSIAISDINECLPGVLRTDVFAIFDFIGSGRKAEAVRLLENSLAGGESVFRLLSLFTGQFEIMLGYKELNAEGHSISKIAQILGERSDWRVKKLGGLAGRFSKEKLQEILQKLYETERNIKTGDIKDRDALTILFAEI